MPKLYHLWPMCLFLTNTLIGSKVVKLLHSQDKFLLLSRRSIWQYVSGALGFPGGLVVKNPTVNARDTRPLGSIPGLGRSPGVGMATHSSILAWEIPWTEEPDWLLPMGSKNSWTQLSN